MTHQFEIRAVEQMRDIVLRAGIEVVHAQHVVPLRHEPFA
jgi:hypothetical protein